MSEDERNFPVEEPVSAATVAAVETIVSTVYPEGDSGVVYEDDTRSGIRLAEERARVEDEQAWFGMLGALDNYPRGGLEYNAIVSDLADQGTAFRKGETVLLAFAEKVLALHQPKRDPAWSLIQHTYCSCGAMEVYEDEDGERTLGPAKYPCATVRAARECGIEVPE